MAIHCLLRYSRIDSSIIVTTGAVIGIGGHWLSIRMIAIYDWKGVKFPVGRERLENWEVILKLFQGAHTNN